MSFRLILLILANEGNMLTNPDRIASMDNDLIFAEAYRRTSWSWLFYDDTKVCGEEKLNARDGICLNSTAEEAAAANNTSIKSKEYQRFILSTLHLMEKREEKLRNYASGGRELLCSKSWSILKMYRTLRFYDMWKFFLFCTMVLKAIYRYDRKWIPVPTDEYLIRIMKPGFHAGTW